MAISLDLSHLPVALTVIDGPQTADELEDYITRMTALHQRRAPYVAVTWMRRFVRTAGHTERMGRWFKETEAATRELCLAAALISDSAAFRFALAAVFLIRPMPCPYQVCGTWPEALAFARAQAARRRLALPELACPWPELARA